MQCTNCLTEGSKVLESRVGHDSLSIRRRRLCTTCSRRFTTYEREEGRVLQIKKKDGSVQPFKREKALRSIQIACQKRQVSPQSMEILASKTEKHFFEQGESLVSSAKLGEFIMSGLCDLDTVAYIRFASVYKDFKTPSQFYSLLERLGVRC